MIKTTNRVDVKGLLYSANLELKTVQNTESSAYGKEYIGGTIDIATDDACLNIVKIAFPYTTPTFGNSNKVNNTYGVLKSIMESGKTVEKVGKEEALKVSVNTSLGLNEFYSDKKTGEPELISSMRCDRGFCSILTSLPEEAKRNKFTIDMVINKVKLIEADPNRGIEEDYAVVSGCAFDYSNAMLPVNFTVRNKNGIDYFQSLDVSPNNIVFTQVFGRIISTTVVKNAVVETAFGDAVDETRRSVKEWEITGAIKNPYPTDDAQAGITVDELKGIMANRETHLAELKGRFEQSRENKPAAATASGANGGFMF